MKMMKKYILSALLPVLAIILAGCTPKGESPDPVDPVNPDPKEPVVLASVFSVGDGVKVNFAAGNLKSADGTIAENQYEAGAFFAWNELFSGGKSLPEGWSSLSSKQWRYLLDGREVALSYTNTVASPVKVEGVSCPGLFIYPDAYSGPAVGDSFTWEQIKEKGIVYLPAAGSGRGASLSGAGRSGYYWANDSINPSLAHNVRFSANSTVAYNAYSPSVKYSVRLVQIAK